MFIAQQVVSWSLRNAFKIHVLTAINLSEADWNIPQAFWIWAYNDNFGSLRTPLMSVFGVRKEFLDVNTPKTSISASAGFICVYGFPYHTAQMHGRLKSMKFPNA